MGLFNKETIESVGLNGKKGKVVVEDVSDGWGNPHYNQIAHFVPDGVPYNAHTICDPQSGVVRLGRFKTTGDENGVSVLVKSIQLQMKANKTKGD